MRDVKGRKEVIKHSAAVQIQNNITLLQRRAWNVLLANAYDELPTEEEHRIAVRELVDLAPKNWAMWNVSTVLM
jgi:hypothetical protein